MGLLVVVVVIMVIGMMSPLDEISDPQKKASLIEEIIDKALIQCYALEGSYPGSLEHLETYGVILDRASYHYYFEGIGSNVKPIVKVIPR
jgi:hypothetical protein